MGKNLTLTGMMGVGKSTIGKILAKKLNYNFIDIDNLIENKEGSSINLIFKSLDNFFPIQDFPDPLTPKIIMSLFIKFQLIQKYLVWLLSYF